MLWVGPSNAAVGRIRTSDDYRLRGFDADNPLRGKGGVSLANNPANPNQIVEVQLDLNNQTCEWNASTDGGLTWPAGGVLVPPAGYNEDAPCSVIGHGANAISSQSVRWGSGQNVYITWGSAPAGQATDALVSKSTDGGLTFAPPVVAMNEFQTGPTSFSDNAFPHIAVQPGGGTGGADKIVVTSEGTTAIPGPHANTGQVRTAVSMDGGQTFAAPVIASPALVCTTPPPAFPAGSASTGCEQPYGAGEHTEPRFGPAGEIYVGWRTTATSLFSSQDPSRANGFIRVGKSTDNGQTWTYTNVINVAGPVYDGPVTPPYGSSPTIFTGSSFPELANDPVSGALYVTWQQDPHLYGNNPGFTAQDHFMHNRSQVYFMKSNDGNASWNGLQRISETPITPLGEWDRLNTETQTRHPEIEVAPDGRVDIAWHDRRYTAPRSCIHTHVACNEVRLGDTMWSYSENGGTSFSANRRVQDRHHNNDVGFDYRFSTYWDFGPHLAHLGTNNILFAWMDSREGNFENDTQDIYLSRTNLRASRGVAPVRNLAELLPRYQDALEESRLQSGVDGPSLPQGNLGDQPSLAAALSQYANPGGGEGVLAATFASRPWTQVVVAPTNDPASQLAGGVLARANVGPLLLSGPNKLPPATAAEAARMQPRFRDDEALSRTIADQATLSSGSNVVNCPGCNFGPDDVGQIVRNSNLPPDTVIVEVVSPGQVVVSNPATGSTVSPGTLTIAPQVGAFVIGNPDQIKPQVVQDLADATGLPVSTIKRISGTPAEIAAQIARQMDRRTTAQKTAGVPAFDAAILVNPNSPDAYAVSTLAAHRRLPVLFIDQNGVPAATTQALADLNINQVLVIGGTDDVSDATLGSIPGATRIGGADQYATSIAVLQESIARGVPKNQIFVVNGDDPRNAAVAGAATARVGGLLLMTHGGSAAEAQSTAGSLGLDQHLDRFVDIPSLKGSFSFPSTTSTSVVSSTSTVVSSTTTSSTSTSVAPTTTIGL